MSYNTLFIYIAIVTLLVSGCTDENITNNYIDTSSSIIGRVLPAEFNTEVSIWQEAKVAIGYTDSSGYFEILNVSIGIYRLKIKPSIGVMSLENIEVKKNETTSLGQIIFNNLVWPFTRSYPIHNDNDVNIGLSRIQFYCDTLLDFNSFKSSVVISPPLEGIWQHRGYPIQYYYDIGQSLLPDTTYTVTIPPSLLLKTGESWDDSLQLSFKTKSSGNFQIDRAYMPYSTTNVHLSNLYGHSYIFSAIFNRALDTSIAQLAISITPEAKLDITIYNTQFSSSELKISNAADFIPNKTYTLTIGKELASETGDLLGIDEVVNFTTEPLLVRGYGFGNSSYPKNTTSAYSLSEFKINLNTTVDLDSLNQAISISPHISGSWASVKRNEYFFISDTSEYLMPEQTYTFTINGSTALVADEGFNNDVTLEYFTEPLYVKKLYPSSGQTVSSGSFLHVEFVSSMKKVLTDSAFQFRLFNGSEVTGTTVWNADSTNFKFTPTDPLISGRYYEIIVDSTAEDINGYKINEAGYSLFKVY